MTQTDNSDDNPSQSLPAELWFDSSAGQATSRSAEQPNGGTEQSESQGQANVAVPAAWLIRAGGQGESAESFIEAGVAAVGFGNLPDLSQVSGRDEIAELIKEDNPQANEESVSNRAGQLLALRSEVRQGDLVVMPKARGSQFALGVVTEPYHYRHDADLRHTISVSWQRTDIPRTSVSEDLRESLNHRRTVTQIKTEGHAQRLYQMMKTGEDPGPSLDLGALVKQFKSETGYPTDAQKEQNRLREEWAEKLKPENIGQLSRENLTDFANTTDSTRRAAQSQYASSRESPAGNLATYVTQGFPPPLWISNLDDAQYAQLLKNISYLCWNNDEPVWARIDRLVGYTGGSRRDTGTSGFAEGNVVRTLAIARPEQFLPATSQSGSWGREAMLSKLNLPIPQGQTFGQKLVDANDRLREHLAPYFDGDPQAIACFLYWLIARDVIQDTSDPQLGLAGVASSLLVDVKFLEDIVALLADKGQVIFYGPPGTGKTYLAQELAKHLAPDDECRTLVQFHPSTSYEDFFEGYRPVGTGAEGGIAYELTPGPLARSAKHAVDNPDRRHVMIIDEINRANLPRVLGELLFLLEYRDESMTTLYRPDKPFWLPKNLWFIGTMNTADRSIALVDAALRRRFHFVPFFPDDGPMKGLLDRWLEREGEPEWIGHLVSAVNEELKKDLEGSHLLLGPSHFMKEYGSSPDSQKEQLRRIWAYNIEPFIEDQFFGDPDQIVNFKFDAVIKRHGPEAKPETKVVPEAHDDSNDANSGNET